MRGLFAPALFGWLLVAGLVVAQTGTTPSTGKSKSPTSSAPRAEGPKFGGQVPDFPPGVFTDGGQYSMEDFKGKVLALYFFESG
jgi:hypothetical protein